MLTLSSPGNTDNILFFIPADEVSAPNPNSQKWYARMLSLSAPEEFLCV